MPTFTGTTLASFFKRILQFGHSGNNGTPTSTTSIESGDGVATSISLSDDVLQVQPQNDNSVGTLLCKNNAGNTILAVDTTNSKVLAGASQIAVNTQYAYFGNDITASASYAADTHYIVAFNNSPLGGSVTGAIGSATSSSFNDTNPASSLTLTTTAYSWTTGYWYVPDNITVDAVHWWHSADAATGDDTAAHLMAYDVVSDNSSTSGNLSGGVVVADGATITNAGFEQSYYQSLTIQSANVDAGQIILFTFASDTVNSDYQISAVCKYHLR